jgi:hypothetical protein
MQAVTLARDTTTSPALSTPAPADTTPFTWEVAASLCAARSEADGSIQLLIADPDGRPHRMLVAFPGDQVGSCRTSPSTWARARAARSRFVDAIVQPSFEGYTLLYGTARLTLALPSGAGGPLRHRPLVLDLELLDERA